MAITVQEAQVIFSSDGLKQVQTQAGAAGAALDRTTTRAGRLMTKLRGVGSALGGVGGMLAGLGAGAAAGWMAKLAAGAETTAIQFEVLLGSAGKAKQMVDDLRALDMNSVFGMVALGDAAKLMMSYNVAGDSVVPMLTTISQVAMGSEEKLHFLTKGFSDVVAKGRLMGQEMIQLTNAGFNPLQEISRTTGVSFAELQKRMEAGKISVEMVAQAFESATGPGGRFYKMNDRMTASTQGQFARLKSEVEKLAIAVGTELLPVANELISWASKLITKTEGAGTKFGTMVAKAREWWTTLSDNVADMGVVVGATVGVMITAFQGFWEQMKGWASAFFDYFQANVANMAHDAGVAARNLQKILTGKTTETKIMHDDFGRPVEVTQSTLERFKGGVAFQAPNIPPAQHASVWEAIQAELETARKIRQEERNKEKAGGKAGAGLGPEKRRPSFGEVAAATAQEAKKGQSQTFSAESLFANIREGALNKQLGIAKQHLQVSQWTLQAQKEAAAALKKIVPGLA